MQNAIEGLRSMSAFNEGWRLQSAREILLLLTLWLISQLPNIKSNHSKWTQISPTKQRAFFTPHFRVYNSLEHQFRDDNAFSFWNTRAKFRPSEAWVLIFARACPNDITSHSDNGKVKWISLNNKPVNWKSKKDKKYHCYLSNLSLKLLLITAQITSLLHILRASLSFSQRIPDSTSHPDHTCHSDVT